jgi:hypothetical protein
MMIEEIKGDFAILMSDQYGNYFCKEFFKYTSSEQRIKILRAIKNKFFDISGSEVGTHPMQRLVEIANNNEEQEFIIAIINPLIIELALHKKASYVLISVLASFPQLLVENQLAPTLIERIKDLSFD